MSRALKKSGLYLALILIMIIFGAGILAQSILPLALALTDTKIYVKTQSGSGIGNARVELYLHGFFGEIPTTPSYTIYSDSSGLARRTLTQGVYTVVITASGYITKTVDIDNRASGEVNPIRSFNISLDPGGTTPIGFDVNFYLVGADDDRVSAYVTCDSETLTSDQHGLARFNLEAGTYSVRFNGYYLKNLGGGTTSLPTQINFDFTGSITVSYATTYTVYLETESIQNTDPPAEKTGYDLTGLINFLRFDLVGIFSFLFSSIILGIPNWILVILVVILFSRR